MWHTVAQVPSNSCTICMVFYGVWVLYPECGIIGFLGFRPRNSIIPHQGYNPYNPYTTIENHYTADLYILYDATNQIHIIASVFPATSTIIMLYSNIIYAAML